METVDCLIESCASFFLMYLVSSLGFSCIILSDKALLWSYGNCFPAIILQGVMWIGIIGSFASGILLACNAIHKLFLMIKGFKW